MTYLIIPMDRDEVGRRYAAWNVISAEVHATDDGDAPVVGLVVWYRSGPGPEGSPILDLAYLQRDQVWTAIADSYGGMDDDDRSELALMINKRSMAAGVEYVRVWSNWCREMRAKQPVPPWRIGDAGDD